MKNRKILVVFHYLPLHLSRMGIQFGGKPGDCPVTEHISDCIVRLPFYYDLSEQEQATVIDAIVEFG
jgi:dTDP-4-amino-4,6-dideoxygalactose transaminase